MGTSRKAKPFYQVFFSFCLLTIKIKLLFSRSDTAFSLDPSGAPVSSCYEINPQLSSIRPLTPKLKHPQSLCGGCLQDRGHKVFDQSVNSFGSQKECYVKLNKDKQKYRQQKILSKFHKKQQLSRIGWKFMEGNGADSPTMSHGMVLSWKCTVSSECLCLQKAPQGEEGRIHGYSQFELVEVK